jgi:hypothetical protein
MPLPTMKSLHERPIRTILSQQSVWAISIFTISASSVLLGFAVATNIKNPGRANTNGNCDNRNDPVFWQMITQLLLHVLFVICVAAPVLRDKEGAFKVQKFWFYASVFTSIVAAVLGVALYATVCGNGGWLASLLLGWAAAVTGAAAAAQLAGGIRRF